MAGIDFVTVVDAGGGYTTVLASDGNTYTFKGDRNWRNNNPGNIEYGKFAKSMGAIGTDGRFAVFPSYSAGQQAQIALQFDSPSYKNLTVKDAIERYAPSFENDSAGYAKKVAGAAGVPLDTKMSDLSAEQRRAFLAAQQSVEGFRPGKIIGENGVPVPASVAQQFKGVPLPAVDIGSSSSTSAQVKQLQQALKSAGFDPGAVDGLMGPRTKAAVKAFQQSNGLTVDGIVGPKTSAALGSTATPAVLPALQAARDRLNAARLSLDPTGTGQAGMSVTPRIPGNYDFTQNVSPTAAEVTAAKANTPSMDVSPIQSRAIILDEGLGSLMNPRSVSPSTPNPAKPPVAGLKVPTGATVDPVGSGASLADLKAFTNPVPAVFKTGQGVAGTVQMPAGVRPSALPPPPAESPLFAPATKPPAGNTLSAPGAGLTAAQKAAISGTGAPIPATRPAGLGAALAPPIPATMPPGLREQGNALPKSTITVKPAAPAAPAQQKLFQSGGYVYSANPAGGYLKIGKMVNGSPVLSGTGSTTAAKSSGTSGGSSTGSLSTAGLKPGDRRYNADTNEWEIK